MTSNHRFLASLGIVLLLSFGAYAQQVTPPANHFSAEGISFDYPIEFSLTDKSTAETQQLILTQKGSSVQLKIVAKRGSVRRSELSGVLESFTEPLVTEIETKVRKGKQTPLRTSFKTQVGTVEADGVRLLAASGTTTGEVIWFRRHFRLIGLVFVRSKADELVGSQLWQTILSSLKVESMMVVGTVKAGVEPSGEKVEGGVLNGRALALPHPTYPAIARAAHASGTVAVQVTIDEEGNVISARAISGHPLLQAASVGAARQARFSPTLLEGEPVKVTGVITYNFVAQ